MIGSIFFIFNRMVEITFLIPIIGIMVSQSPFPRKANALNHPPY
jgi:hypothetical protein